jgi:hypothetical protein
LPPSAILPSDADRALAMDIAFASADVIAQKIAKHIEAKNFLILRLKDELQLVTSQLGLYASPKDTASRRIVIGASELLRGI